MFESLMEDSTPKSQTAEEFFDNNPEALELLPQLLFVRAIEQTPYGYRVMTDLFTLYTSHKYRRLASAIKRYLSAINSIPSYTNKRPTGHLSPMVNVKGLNDKGYVDFDFGQCPDEEYKIVQFSEPGLEKGQNRWTFYSLSSFDDKGNLTDPDVPQLPDNPLLQYVVDNFVEELDIPVMQPDKPKRTSRGKGQG